MAKTRVKTNAGYFTSQNQSHYVLIVRNERMVACFLYQLIQMDLSVPILYKQKVGDRCQAELSLKTQKVAALKRVQNS